MIDDSCIMKVYFGLNSNHLERSGAARYWHCNWLVASLAELNW